MVYGCDQLVTGDDHPCLVEMPERVPRYDTYTEWNYQSLQTITAPYVQGWDGCYWVQDRYNARWYSGSVITQIKFVLEQPTGTGLEDVAYLTDEPPLVAPPASLLADRPSCTNN